MLLRIAGIICTGNSVYGILSFLIQIMSQSNFLTTLQSFPKDTINDEMVELLAPYLEMEDYNMETAKRVCSFSNERTKFILWQHHGVCQCHNCLGAFLCAKSTGHKWNNTVVLSQGPLVIQPKLSKIWKQRQMVQKFTGNVSRNSGNFWIFRSTNHSTENSWNSGSNVKWKGKLRENFFENRWKCCPFRYCKLPKIPAGSFGWMESASSLLSDRSVHLRFDRFVLQMEG